MAKLRRPWRHTVALSLLTCSSAGSAPPESAYLRQLLRRRLQLDSADDLMNAGDSAEADVPQKLSATASGGLERARATGDQLSDAVSSKASDHARVASEHAPKLLEAGQQAIVEGGIERVSKEGGFESVSKEHLQSMDQAVSSKLHSAADHVEQLAGDASGLNHTLGSSMSEAMENTLNRKSKPPPSCSHVDSFCQKSTCHVAFGMMTTMSCDPYRGETVCCGSSTFPMPKAGNCYCKDGTCGGDGRCRDKPGGWQRLYSSPNATSSGLGGGDSSAPRPMADRLVPGAVAILVATYAGALAAAVTLASRLCRMTRWSGRRRGDGRTDGNRTLLCVTKAETEVEAEDSSSPSEESQLE